MDENIVDHLGFRFDGWKSKFTGDEFLFDFCDFTGLEQAVNLNVLYSEWL